MEEGEGGGQKLSKRFSDQVGGGSGEVDFKTKSGTAWSHNFLNQKPWHPLSYPNQRRKWIAEQTHANRQRRAEEVSREFNQEQEFFRQTALVSKKEKEKMEMMKAVSFMYVRPPGYNAESAKAAEVSDERKQQDPSEPQQDPTVDGTSTSMPLMPGRDQPRDEKKKRVPKDVFGRALPTEEQFEILKNAPRMETGAPARVKPFGVEVRNVKCLRCGTYGHQSGDRECPLKDAIMPNEESRLKRNDPLTAMLAHTDASEPLKWELKQKPGISPPRGGFNPEDPNQQIVAEDIFDEYGGFLSGEIIPDLLANFSSEKPKKSKSKKKHGRRSSPTSTEPKNRKGEELLNDEDDRKRSKKRKHTAKKQKHSESSPSDNAELHKRAGSSDDENKRKSSKKRNHDGKKHKRYESSSSEDAGFDRWRGSFNEDERKRSTKKNDKRTKRKHSESSSSEDAEYDRHRRRSRHGRSSPSEDLAYDGRRRSKHRHLSRHRRHRNRSDSSSE